MASITSTPTPSGEPGPPYIVRYRWKPDGNGKLKAGRFTFRRPDSAQKWVRDFDYARERGGWAGAREFVLAWQARDADDEEDREPTLGEFILGWLMKDAKRGLEPATIDIYVRQWNNHIRAVPLDPRDESPDAPTFGGQPLSAYAEPFIVKELREVLDASGRNKPTIDSTLKMLSSALSWGTENRRFRRWLPTNGCRLTTKRNRRRDRDEHPPETETLPRSRVFSAYDFEFVRRELLARTSQRTYEHERDAAFLSLQFGCGVRPAEDRGSLWRHVIWPTDTAKGVLRVHQSVAYGRLTGVKTKIRDAILPQPIADDLRRWKAVADAHGVPTGPNDYIIPGMALDGHMSRSQEKRWGSKFLRPALRAVAGKYPERDYLKKSTSYAARRGHISSRLAAGEAVPTVARDCGTSQQTIARHYHEDVGTDFPRPYPDFEEQILKARAEVAAMTWTPYVKLQELTCAEGHKWERPSQSGPKPKVCPQHRAAREAAVVVDLPARDHGRALPAAS